MARREWNGAETGAPTKTRSPQASDYPCARTRGYEKKDQAIEWLVFFIGGVAATPYQPLKLNRLCRVRVRANWRGRARFTLWIPVLALCEDCVEHCRKFISSIPHFGIEPQSAWSLYRPLALAGPTLAL